MEESDTLIIDGTIHNWKTSSRLKGTPYNLSWSIDFVNEEKYASLLLHIKDSFKGIAEEEAKLADYSDFSNHSYRIYLNVRAKDGETMYRIAQKMFDHEDTDKLYYEDGSKFSLCALKTHIDLIEAEIMGTR